MRISFIKNHEKSGRSISPKKIMNDQKCLDADGCEILSGDLIETNEYEYYWKKSNEYILHAINFGEYGTEKSVVTVRVTNRHTAEVCTMQIDAENLHVIGLSAREYLQRIQNSIEPQVRSRHSVTEENTADQYAEKNNE